MVGISAHVSEQMVARLVGRVVSTSSSLRDVRHAMTGEVLCQVPDACPADVERAVAETRRVQEDWAQKPMSERVRVFLRFHDLVLARQQEILDLIQLENGKARTHAFEEVLDVAMTCRYYAQVAGKLLAPVRVAGAFPVLTQTRVMRRPRGVVSVIAPWNYPLTLAISDAIPALIAGNAVVLKPDEKTPLCALWAAALLEEAGLPEGLLQVVPGEGAVLGDALVDGSDYVMFTGSTATGRKVAGKAGKRLIGCSMELGGKNALILLEDADVSRAVSGAIRGCFSNTGQLCISIERIYVPATLWNEFVPAFVTATEKLRLGAGIDFSADVGSLISSEQLGRVQGHIRNAVAQGATVLAGGNRREDIGPNFFEPTILTNVTEQMTVYRQETFGPVVSLYRVESVDEAVELTNASEYGLNASIWGQDIERAQEVAGRIHAGIVNINETYAAAWASLEAPMGGMKSSGIGRRHGAEGLLKYTEAQTIAIQRGLPVGQPNGVNPRLFGALATAGMKVLRRIPGKK